MIKLGHKEPLSVAVFEIISVLFEQENNWEREEGRKWERVRKKILRDIIPIALIVEVIL